MEITKCLHDDILKIQTELVTAIQNHQVLVLRQQVCPSDSVKTQIQEVQRHIICLGESQKILVNRLRNEIESQTPILNIKHKNTLFKQHIKAEKGNENFKKKSKSQDLGRSLLLKNAKNKGHLINTSNASDSENSERNSVVIIERQLSVDSSSEENRTPCQSPVNGNNGEKRKRTLSDSLRCPSKRPKSTLQATPRPSSPVPARSIDTLSSSSDESLDSLLSQQPESENKVDFALALGLVTKDVFNKVIKKKSERRRRRVSSQHHLYNNLWDLTVLQKRSHVNDPEPEAADDVSRDCPSPQSDLDGLCFICQKPGYLRDCRVCQTGCHVYCVRNEICPACTHRAYSTPPSPLIADANCHGEPISS